MIIIVEGIDRIGKSTFCNKLHFVTGSKVFHDEHKYDFSLINETVLDVKYSMLIQMFKVMGNIIVDRFHLTEYVYNSLRGDKWAGFYKVDEILSKLDTMLILIQSEDIIKSSKQHGSDLYAHHVLFKHMYEQSKIQNKHLLTYSKFNKFIKENFANGEQLHFGWRNNGADFAGAFKG